jgi:glutamine synthetase
MNVSPELPFKDPQALTEELQQRGVSLCFVQWTKPAGDLVGCWVPLPHLPSSLQKGVCLEHSQLSKYGSDSEVKTLRPVAETTRVFGCLDGFAHLIAEVAPEHHSNHDCFRLSLREYLEKLQRGFPDLNVKVERRAHFFFRSLPDVQTSGSSRLYANANMNDYMPMFRARNFLMRLHEWLAFVGFDIVRIEHCAGGQFLCHYAGSSALDAADDWVRFRLLVAQIADEMQIECELGMGHSFDLSPSPLILDMKEGSRSILVSQGNLTQKGENFVAGLLSQADKIAESQHISLTVFKRQYSTYHITNDGIQWNLANGAANPYSVILTLLQAGIEGIAQGKKLPKTE